MEQWAKELPLIAITIIDTEGKILDMNDRAAWTNQKWGGMELIGKDVYKCHPPKAQEIIHHIMNSKEVNVYSIEKEGLNKLIYQTPWYNNGELGGLVELSLTLPEHIEHKIRK